MTAETSCRWLRNLCLPVWAPHRYHLPARHGQWLDGEPFFFVPHHFARVCLWGGHSHLLEGEPNARIAILATEGTAELHNGGSGTRLWHCPWLPLRPDLLPWCRLLCGEEAALLVPVKTHAPLCCANSGSRVSLLFQYVPFVHRCRPVCGSAPGGCVGSAGGDVWAVQSRC